MYQSKLLKIYFPKSCFEKDPPTFLFLNMSASHYDTGSSVKPPKLNVHDFSDWKNRMTAFLSAIDDFIVDSIIVDGPYKPMSTSSDEVARQIEKPRAQWTDEERRLASLNSKA